LHELRVFVVEDEFTVLLMIETMLADLGCTIAGSASRVGEALQRLRHCGPDAAVLDVNVAGEPVYPVAQALVLRNVPFVFSTGYGIDGIGAQWRSRPILHKPYRTAALGAALRAELREADVRGQRENAERDSR
jgi:CheY-like chemotaxis protein